MIRKEGYDCTIPKWGAYHIGAKDKSVYPCALCGKKLKAGDWALVSNDNRLILCGVIDNAS